MRAAAPAIVLLAAALAVGAAAAACGSGSDGDQSTAAELGGRSFTATTMTAGGEPRPLVPGTQLTLSFERRDEQDTIRWRAGCNTFATDVEIEAESLLLGPIGGTEIACARQRRQQDEWLADFFGSDPRWSTVDDRLTLTAEEAAIELVETRPGSE